MTAPNPAKPRVAVLMATYNGERWLREQVDSILAQRNVDVTLFFADDGSSDRTLEIMAGYSGSDDRIRQVAGPRMGTAARNFARLLHEVDVPAFDFIAFSDQDDIWLERKLDRAIREMSRTNAAGYAANMLAFREDGAKQLVDKSHRQRRLDFLFQSASAACTCVLRMEAARTLSEVVGGSFTGWSDEVSFDCVIYAVVRSRGHLWVTDADPTILYRQHANNVIGANIGWRAARKRLDMVRRRWIGNHVASLLPYCATSADVESVARRIRDRSASSRMWLAGHANDFRREAKARLALRAFFLFGWF